MCHDRFPGSEAVLHRDDQSGSDHTSDGQPSCWTSMGHDGNLTILVLLKNVLGCLQFFSLQNLRTNVTRMGDFYTFLAKLSHKRSPNILLTFGAISNNVTFWAIFEGNMATFYSIIWSHCSGPNKCLSIEFNVYF